MSDKRNESGFSVVIFSMVELEARFSEILGEEMKEKPGDRVGAILSAKDDTVKFLGFGVYVGDRIPPENISPILHKAEIKNPQIDLDSGKSVYGLECWWGSEAAIRAEMEKFRVIENVDIDEVRKST